MRSRLLPARFALTTIARTGDRFADFRPYVASVDDGGIVGFQAATVAGERGAFAGSGGEAAGLAEGCEVISHPDLSAGGACFYARRAGGGEAVRLVLDGAVQVLAASGGRFRCIGPLGPSMNGDGAVAFRATTTAGAEGLFVGRGGDIATVALAGDGFDGFEGIPVVTGDGAVVFHGVRGDGRGIYRWRDGGRETLAETGERFAELGSFPAANDRGAVVFAAVLTGGGGGIFVAEAGRITALVDTGAGFGSFRGALIDDDGRVIFYATPRGGELGIYGGADPVGDRILGVGDDGVTELALNPVSINGAGQLAIRVARADGTQAIVRADRV